MKKLVLALSFLFALGLVSVNAQEKKEAPKKEMKAEKKEVKAAAKAEVKPAAKAAVKK